MGKNSLGYLIIWVLMDKPTITVIPPLKLI